MTSLERLEEILTKGLELDCPNWVVEVEIVDSETDLGGRVQKGPALTSNSYCTVTGKQECPLLQEGGVDSHTECEHYQQGLEVVDAPLPSVPARIPRGDEVRYFN